MRKVSWAKDYGKRYPEVLNSIGNFLGAFWRETAYARADAQSLSLPGTGTKTNPHFSQPREKCARSADIRRGQPRTLCPCELLPKRVATCELLIGLKACEKFRLVRFEMD
jgi:hypothetical protein